MCPCHVRSLYRSTVGFLFHLVNKIKLKKKTLYMGLDKDSVKGAGEEMLVGKSYLLNKEGKK